MSSVPLEVRHCDDDGASATYAGGHPRPQLVRSDWVDLGGAWGFTFDDGNEGVRQRWFARGEVAATRFDRTIVVPYPPESPASGVEDTGFHPIVWYRRALKPPASVKPGSRQILHFGAVDYRAKVWLSGDYLGEHEGGSTPFWFDVTELLEGDCSEHLLVVRAEDDPRDLAQPRGKQDWRLHPQGIWHHRTTGIWQSVWLEIVPTLHITDLVWKPHILSGAVELVVELNDTPAGRATVSVELQHEATPLARLSFDMLNRRSAVTFSVSAQGNSLERNELLWSPERPRLISAQVSLRAGESVDTVGSYFGMRSVGWDEGHFLLNDQPYYIRGVLEQGYWPESHLAPPDDGALRAEIELIKSLGFNTARLHQKIEDPRFLYWADRLGLLIWAECPSAYEFSEIAVNRTVREWLEVIRRDRSHPCIVTWVPVNESWGVREIAHDPAQLDYVRALYFMTKALDPSRPVVSNDGWEHADSDIITIHDYSLTHNELAANYRDHSSVLRLLSGIGPLGRRIRLVDTPIQGQPIVVSEFGGVGFDPDNVEPTWGYSTTTSASEFESALRAVFDAVHVSPILAGFCYTQLTDTLGEANGLTDPYRRPKLDVDVIRALVSGDAFDTRSHRRPKQPQEVPNASRPHEPRVDSEVLTGDERRLASPCRLHTHVGEPD